MIVYAAGGNARNIFGVQNLQYGAGVQECIPLKRLLSVAGTRPTIL
jgi:hypothetical protein